MKDRTFRAKGAALRGTPLAWGRAFALAVLLSAALAPPALAGWQGTPRSGGAVEIVMQSPTTLGAQPVQFIEQDMPEFRYLNVIDSLERNGYRILLVEKTWLNRMLIRAQSRRHLREVVVSRSNGEVLRDVILESYGPATGEQPLPFPYEPGQ